MNSTQQRYRIFANLQTGLAAMIVLGLGLVYRLKPELARNASATFASLMISALVVGYFFSLHQILKTKFVKLSAIVVGLLSAANIWLVIAQTGGLNSPYLGLWLIFVAGLGIAGNLLPLAALVLTLGIYGFDLIHNHPHGGALLSRLWQIGFLIAATVLAERVAHFLAQRQKQMPQSANLGAEQLQAQALMASMGEGVVVVNRQRQIQLFNRAAQLLTGWDERSAQNLDYRTVLKLKTAQDQPLDEANDPFMRAWAQKSAVVNDLIITTQAGRRFAATMTTSPIMAADGTVTGGIALFRDVSAEKAMERQKNEFISTASHEMRTPIAAIEGYLALALNPATATIDDRAKGYLDKAHQSIGHLGELFKNLLVITKLEDRQLADKLEQVNLSQLVERAVEDMKAVATQKGLALRLTSGNQLVAEANPIIPIYLVKANPERLREVVMNLIDNAIKYTPSGHITVSISGDNDNVSVSVADTGLGIASEDLPHLFQKFYRVDNSQTRTIGGTGLGLYIARTIIELYGGQIWAESKLGAGTTFNFRLPKLKAALADAPGSVAQPDLITTGPTAPLPTVPVDAVQPAVATANNNLLSLKAKQS